MGTVSGLALLAGGTAVAAVAGGAHSVFATVLLGMLTVGMSHALLTEIRRQARRRNADGWAAQDTVNTVLLASWASGALIATLLAVAPASVRAVGLLLTLGYAVSCAYFVIERCRTIADGTPAATELHHPAAHAAPTSPDVNHPAALAAPASPDVTHQSARTASASTEVTHLPVLEAKPAPVASETEPAESDAGKVPAESA